MPATDRKPKILAAARDLLQTKGYPGFSYSDLSERLGIAKPSIHHHYPTKEDLGLAVIESYREMLHEMQRELKSEKGGPADQLRGFLAFGEQEMCDSDHAICPGGAMHANYESFPESIQRAVLGLSEEIHAWMADLLRRGSEAGEIHVTGSADDAAWSLLASLQGGRQQARTHGIGVWRAVVRQIESTYLRDS